MRLPFRAACSWVALLTFVLAVPWSALGQDRPKGKKKSDEPAAESKDPGAAEKPKAKEKDDAGEFGSARKKGKDADDKGGKAKPGSKEDRAVQKYKDDLTKKLDKQLKKGMNFFVVAVQETAFEKWEAGGAPPANARVLPGGYVAGTPTVEVQVLEGREMALDYLVDYLSKYPPAQQRARSSKPRRGEPAEPPGPPDPHREVLRADGFKEKDQAFARQEQIQQQIDAAAERGPGGKADGRPRGKRKPN